MAWQLILLGAGMIMVGFVILVAAELRTACTHVRGRGLEVVVAGMIFAIMGA